MTWPTGDSLDPTVDATWVTADNGTIVTPTPDPIIPIAVDQYIELITSYHRGRPKFVAMLQALFAPVAEGYNILQNMPIDYDLDSAIGTQLDVLGEWIGRSRRIPVPIPGIYFSFDDPPKGFDLGIWKGPFDSDEGITVLDDETYRTLLRAKIAANNWNGQISTARDALSIIFPNGDTQIFITDNLDMSMTFGVSGKIPSLLFIVLLSRGYIPLKPEGVFANYLLTTVDGPLFGFDVQNEYISGFDTGAWGAEPTYFTGP